MIEEPRRTGMLGELYAGRYLRNKGYDLLCANYTAKSGEIDIIARTGDCVCFVEVKTRHEGSYFTPAEAVDTKKEENVKSAAAAFLAYSKIKCSTRYDIIEVIIYDSGYKLRHIENAF